MLAVDVLAVKDRMLGGGVGKSVEKDVPKKSAFREEPTEPEREGGLERGLGGGTGSEDVSENGELKKSWVLLPPLGG